MKSPRLPVRRSRILRLLAIAFLILPFTGLLEREAFNPPEDILVLDGSRSMERRFPGFSAGILASLDGEGIPAPVVIAGEHAMARSASTASGGGFTDLAAALRAVASLFSPHAPKRILLATDGLSEREGMAAALSLLEREKIAVYAFTPPEPGTQAGVTAIIIPDRAYLWEPFAVKARILSSRRGAVTVVLERDGVEITEAVVEVDRTGRGEVQFVQEADRVGSLRYRLFLRDFDHPGAAGEVRVSSSPNVLYVVDDPLASRRLVGILRERGIGVTTARPGDLVYDPRILDAADIIVLDDLPAPALGEEAVRRLARTVAADGKGLLVIGGRRGLGSDDYRGSPLEGILPVTLGYSAPPEPAPVSMVLAMDTSFSMTFRGSGRGSAHGSQPRKIDVAKESAKEVVRVIRPGDRLGIIGNSTDLYWVHRTGPVGDRDDLAGRIGRLKPRGDGINFYSIVREASASLSGSPSAVRHVLVFGDAEDIDQYEVAGEGHSYDLVRNMAREGITLSVLAIGQPTDKDVPYLRTATLLGGAP